MELAKCDVVFDSEAHSYTLWGNKLSGVTTMLGRMLFPDKHSGIDPEVLQKAADRGHAVHAAIEIGDTLGIASDMDEYRDYVRLRDEAGLKPIANEYLISDYASIASSIDVVYEGNILADIKTTSKIETEYVSWQLSIYAYLFEKMNEGQKVDSLLVIWLPKPSYGKAKIKTVKRKSDEAVETLIKCYRQYLKLLKYGK